MQKLLSKCIDTGNKLLKSTINLSNKTESEFSDLILYLVRLYETTKDSSYLNKAEEMGIRLYGFIKQNNTLNYGFYEGRMKSYYTLIKINEVSSNKSEIELPYKELKEFANYNHSFNNLYNGKAGTLISLLHIYIKTKEEALLVNIKEYIESILSNFFFSQEGIYWDYTYNISKGLCSLGEGNSGIGFIFLELGYFFNIDQLKELGELAFSYEDKLWDEIETNWPDFKVIIEDEKDHLSLKEEYIISGLFSSTKQRKDFSWTEGITGIGLARLRAYELTKKETYLQFVDKIYNKLYSSIDNLSSEELIDSIFFCIQVSQVINDSKYYNLAEELTEKISKDNSSNNNIKISNILLQFIDPSLKSHFYPIIKTTNSSKALKFDDHFVKRKIMKKAFNITTQIFERKHSNQLQNLCTRINLSDINNSILLIEEIIYQLNDEHLKDVFQFEKKKIDLFQKIENISELFMKEVIHREEIEYLFNLDRDHFNQEYLILNSNLSLVETKWDWWTIEDPRKEGFIDPLENLNKPPKEYYAIMRIKWDSKDPVYTRSLTTFSDLLLENFHSPTTIGDAMNSFLNSFEVKTEEKKEELKKLGQDIIEALFESGILLRSKGKQLSTFIV